MTNSHISLIYVSARFLVRSSPAHSGIALFMFWVQVVHYCSYIYVIALKLRLSLFFVYFTPFVFPLVWISYLYHWPNSKVCLLKFIGAFSKNIKFLFAIYFFSFFFLGYHCFWTLSWYILPGLKYTSFPSWLLGFLWLGRSPTYRFLQIFF